MILFGRRAEVVIGVPGKQGRSFAGLRTIFAVTKSIEKALNPAEIIVYNLSQDSRVFAQSKGVKIYLSAGYDQGMQISQPILKTIFIGDIIDVQTSKQDGGSIVTKFTCSDSTTAAATARVDATFEKGVSINALLNQAARELGVGVGEIQGFAGKQFVNGYTATGLAKDQLDILAAKTGTQWSIQDGVLQFILKDGFTKDSVVVLNSSSGLVGSPNQTKADPNKPDKKAGVSFISLLQPEIKPGRRIQVESKFVTGLFVTQTVTHRGDTRSGPFYSECEAI